MTSTNPQDQNDFVTLDFFLSAVDVTTKELTVPKTIPFWEGKKFLIKNLTRAEQDTYLNRQFGLTKMRQTAKSKEQVIDGMKVYGHDAWLVSIGVVKDASGVPLFSEQHISVIASKNGALVGWLAKEIVKFSDMEEDDKVARGEADPNQVLADDVKNS